MLGEVEERLAEEVRRYPNLYDSSSKHYKDNKLATSSWKEISERTGLQSAEEAAKKWKNLRDKYVRLQRKMVPASGRAGSKKTPALVVILSWLAPHIRHRDIASSCDAKVSFKFNFTLLIPLGIQKFPIERLKHRKYGYVKIIALWMRMMLLQQKRRFLHAFYLTLAGTFSAWCSSVRIKPSLICRGSYHSVA